MTPLATLRSPNLGHPVLAQRRREGEVTFHAVIAGTTPDLDVTGLFRSRLFLSSLSDTRTIYQDSEYPPPLWDQTQLAKRVAHRMVPLEIREVKPAQPSPWHRSPICSTDHVWIEPDPHRYYPYAYQVTLAVPGKHAHCLKVPALYNLVHLVPEERCDVKFHAVYVHENDWNDFTIAHATDLHIAWRNDFIPERLAATGNPVSLDRYVNFNEHFRQFIAYANRAHAAGELDLIVANGDIVDYIYESGALRPVDIWHYPGASDQYAIDNFEYFHDLVIARSPSSLRSGSGIKVGEELEVPLFTTLGNHDYRLNEYPLTMKVDPDLGFIPLPFLARTVNKYHIFGLTGDQANAFEGGFRSVDDDAASDFIMPLSRPDDEPLPRSYAMHINPDANYVVSLGSNCLVVLDTQSDEGIVTTEGSALFPSGSQTDFLAGHPDSLGFDNAQLDILSNVLKGADGTVMMVCHAPPVNLQGYHQTPHHLMRECEHATLDSDDQTALLFDISRNRGAWLALYTAVQRVLKTPCIARVEQRGVAPGIHPTQQGEGEKGRRTGQWMNLRVTAGDVARGGQRYGVGSNSFRVSSFGGPDRILDEMKVGEYVGVYRGTPDRFDSHYWEWKRIDLSWLVNQLSSFASGNWSLMSEYFFKSNRRDPFMGDGVAHAGFDRLVNLLIGREVPGKAVDMLLAGHTHQSIEFRLTKLDDDVKYSHDYYLDNTIHGLSAREFWREPRDPKEWGWPRFDPAFVPDYPDPLSATNDAAAWWHKHRPLIIQTASLGVNPGGKDRRKTPGASVLLIQLKNNVITGTRRVLVDDMAAPVNWRATAPTESLVALQIV